jgi:hypothetical protein
MYTYRDKESCEIVFYGCTVRRTTAGKSIEKKSETNNRKAKMHFSNSPFFPFGLQCGQQTKPSIRQGITSIKPIRPNGRVDTVHLPFNYDKLAWSKNHGKTQQ